MRIRVGGSEGRGSVDEGEKGPSEVFKVDGDGKGLSEVLKVNGDVKGEGK